LEQENTLLKDENTELQALRNTLYDNDQIINQWEERTDELSESVTALEYQLKEQEQEACDAIEQWQATCSELNCPAGSTRAENSVMLLCAGSSCQVTDYAICCQPLPTCGNYTCPPGRENKQRGWCTTSPCPIEDEDHCCSPAHPPPPLKAETGPGPGQPLARPKAKPKAKAPAPCPKAKKKLCLHADSSGAIAYRKCEESDPCHKLRRLRALVHIACKPGFCISTGQTANTSNGCYPLFAAPCNDDDPHQQWYKSGSGLNAPGISRWINQATGGVTGAGKDAVEAEAC